MNIEVSFFSLCMGILFSSFFILIVHLLRKNRSFLKGFGILSVLMLYMLCIFRMGVPIESHISIPIRVSKFYNDLYEFLIEGHWEAFGIELVVLDIIKCIWFVVAFLLMVLLFTFHCRNIFHYSQFQNNRHLRGEEILKTVKAEAKRQYKVCLVVYPTANVPKTVGLFKRIILLPSGEYTDEELYYILTHEYTHILNRDLLVKMLANIFICVFWWNPLVYLLRLDLDQMLEIKCDSTVIQRFTNSQIQTYMNLLIRLYDDAKAPKGFFCRIASIFSMSFVRRGKRKRDLYYSDLVERFDMIANQPRKKRVLSTQFIFYSICAAVMITSYLFIFQPFYEPPREDIYTNSSVIEFDISDGYILKHNDGKYFMMNEDVEVFEIKEEIVEWYVKSGYRIREE